LALLHSISSCQGGGISPFPFCRPPRVPKVVTLHPPACQSFLFLIGGRGDYLTPALSCTWARRLQASAPSFPLKQIDSGRPFRFGRRSSDVLPRHEPSASHSPFHDVMDFFLPRTKEGGSATPFFLPPLFFPPGFLTPFFTAGPSCHFSLH